MHILGINAYHPDSSAAIIKDGRLVAAAEEERFRRIKHFAGFPIDAIRYCVKEAGLSIKSVDFIAIPRCPTARLFKKIFYGVKIPALALRRLSAWGKTFGVARELSQAFGVGEDEIRAKVIKVEHHAAHIASSFFVSGFGEAALLSIDALGDFASTMWGNGRDNKIEISGETTFPHSLGFYYTAITQYLGFLDFGDEYKVMGLAAYGEAAFEDEFKKILKLKEGGFELGLEYFLHHKKMIDMSFKDGRPEVAQIFSSYLEERLGKRRIPEEPIEKRHRDIAASLQKRLEEAICHILNSFNSASTNLCLAGGVAFNCVANGKILSDTPFKNIYIPPAAGDAGLAIGAAYYLWNKLLNKPRTFFMKHAYWGPQFARDEIAGKIDEKFNGPQYKNYLVEHIDNHDELCRQVAGFIAEGKVVGWFQGRMEWGPRALGNRSILADPRREEMKDVLNERIKHRAPFRPFAPSILEEDLEDYFETNHPSPFMLFAYRVRKDKLGLIPAVVHKDLTARVQTVNSDTNPLYWKLINEFKKLTGIPVLLNTSFNENEPIVYRPEEAIECFLRTGMDILVIGDYLIQRLFERERCG